MKKLLSLLMALFCLSSATLHAQTFIPPTQDSVLTEYHDGKLWAYLHKGDFVVGLTCSTEEDSYGSYYQIGIFIENLQTSPYTFQPKVVFANLYNKRNELAPLEVYTHEEYQKKIERSQTLTMLALGLTSGLNAGLAAYSTSYSTTYSPEGYAYTTMTNTYNPMAAYQANMAATTQILTMGQMMENDRIIRRQGYLKTSTIYPREAIVGFMNIKKKKGKTLEVTIPVNGTDYKFTWDVSKKKKEKK